VRWRRECAVFLMLMGGLVTAGCRPDPIDQWITECEHVQDVEMRVREDLAKALHDPRSNDALVELAVRRGTGELRSAAGAVHDPVLRDALAKQADDFAELALYPIDDFAFLFATEQADLTIVEKCSRTPGI
jgi:hypothetical protein